MPLAAITLALKPVNFGPLPFFNVRLGICTQDKNCNSYVLVRNENGLLFFRILANCECKLRNKMYTSLQLLT